MDYKSYFHIGFLNLAILFLFSVKLVGMYTPQAAEMRKQHYGLMKRRQELLYPHKQKIHSIPMGDQSLTNLGLCPLFKKQEGYAIDSTLVAEMKSDLRRQGLSEADIEQQLVGMSSAPGPKCHVFIGNSTETRFAEIPVKESVSCQVSLGYFEQCNRSLFQLKGIDQFELAEKTSLSPALCGGNALNNACLIRDYAETGEVKYLSHLHNLNEAANFLLNIGIGDWINVEVVKDSLAKMSKDLDIDTDNISAVSSAILFNSELGTSAEFSLYDQNEYAYVQKLKEKLRADLKKDYFTHVIIVGNEEATESHGHYFAFAIIKSRNVVQYVVIDTLPNVYHLQEGSHERNRLMYVIDNIEQGRSNIDLANIRTYMLRLHGAFEQSIQQ